MRRSNKIVPYSIQLERLRNCPLTKTFESGFKHSQFIYWKGFFFTTYGVGYYGRITMYKRFTRLGFVKVVVRLPNINSALHRHGAAIPPHVWDFDSRKEEATLCLHMGNEFSRSMLLDKSIIPWTLEWLYFYQIWEVTGNWDGGGHK